MYVLDPSDAVARQDYGGRPTMLLTPSPGADAGADADGQQPASIKTTYMYRERSRGAAA
jgi:hypothetical protein